MLKRIHIDNYKPLCGFELKLDEVNLLLGLNGSGKTSVLDVLSAVIRVLHGAEIEGKSAFRPSTKTRWRNEPVQTFEIEAELGGDIFTYRLEIEHTAVLERGAEKSMSRIRHESLNSDGKPLFLFDLGKVQLYNDSHKEGPVFESDWKFSALARVVPGGSNKKLSAFAEFMRSMIICSIAPDSLSDTAEEPDEELSLDAANFPAWYWSRILERPDRIQGYLDSMKNVLDGCTNIGMDKFNSEARALAVSFSKDGADYKLRFNELSHGQRVLMVLYALIHFAEDAFALFLDEPENYVSLREIRPWLSELKIACEDYNGQVLVCSHHPELINHLGGESGIFLKQDTDSKIAAKPVAEMDFEDDGLKLSDYVTRGWI